MKWVDDENLSVLIDNLSILIDKLSIPILNFHLRRFNRTQAFDSTMFKNYQSLSVTLRILRQLVQRYKRNNFSKCNNLHIVWKYLQYTSSPYNCNSRAERERWKKPSAWLLWMNLIEKQNILTYTVYIPMKIFLDPLYWRFHVCWSWIFQLMR